MSDKSKKGIKPRTAWQPILPVPEGTPAARVSHPNRGEPLRVFPYNDAAGQLLGYACRFLTSTGEPLHLPLTWCQDQDGQRGWRWIQFERFRPLYGLDRLAQCDEVDNILLVFDEHAAEQARLLVPWLTPVSWPGGVRKIDEADWSALRGRSVWIWPTLTRARGKVRIGDELATNALLPRPRQPGWAAAQKLEKMLLGFGCSVMAIIDPFADESLPEGFDAGMAAMQDWTPERTQEWMMAHAIAGEGTDLQQRMRALRGEQQPSAESISTPSEAGAGKDEKAIWIPDLIWKKDGLAACLSNVYQILSHRPEWRGVAAYDEFSLCVVKRRPPPFEGGVTGEWDSTDDSRAAMWLSRAYSFTPSSATVAEAIEVLARANSWHPVRTWLRSLEWDGTPRLETWLSSYLGVDLTNYTRRVAKWWIMGAVKRVLHPGCKFDYCLVLEGPQGKGKSTALAIIGGDWFGDTDLDLAHKDSMSALRGKLVYEIAELGALARSEEKRQKSFLSRRVDEYRPVYGRREIKAPRQLVFGGSTNEFEWNKDPTGGRRFWPCECLGEFDLDGLREIRAQLFAEALLCVEDGQRCFPTAAEQTKFFDPVQLKVEQQESLVDALHDWVYARVANFTAAEAMMDCLKLDASKMTRDMQTRVGIALRKLGCAREERRNGMVRFWYKPPERKEAESKAKQPAQQDWDGDEHAPF